MSVSLRCVKKTILRTVLFVNTTLDVELNRIKSVLLEAGNFHCVSAVTEIKCIVDYVGEGLLPCNSDLKLSIVR